MVKNHYENREWLWRTAGWIHLDMDGGERAGGPTANIYFCPLPLADSPDADVSQPITWGRKCQNNESLGAQTWGKSFKKRNVCKYTNK